MAIRNLNEYLDKISELTSRISDDISDADAYTKDLISKLNEIVLDIMQHNYVINPDTQEYLSDLGITFPEDYLWFANLPEEQQDDLYDRWDSLYTQADTFCDKSHTIGYVSEIINDDILRNIL